jgi:hypothetical protein
MIKTQIQLPDELYHALKRVAARQEWSLAETLRRGAEQLLQQYPKMTAPETETVEAWRPPVSNVVGWRGLSGEELKAALDGDREPEWAETSR